MLAARDPKNLKEAEYLLKTKGGSCTSVPTDIRREDQVKGLVTQVKEHYGRIDILINNAGVMVYGSLDSATVEDWDKVLDTNLKGAFLCSREVLPLMLRQGMGQIINVASGAGKTGFPNLAVYCASKFGLVGFSEALAREVSHTNIIISCLCPGYVETEMLGLFPEDLLKKISPVKPMVVAEQIVQLIVYPHATERRKGFLESAARKGIQWITRKKSG